MNHDDEKPLAYPGIKMVKVVWRFKKIDNLSSKARVAHTTAKQFFLSR